MRGMAGGSSGSLAADFGQRCAAGFGSNFGVADPDKSDDFFLLGVDAQQAVGFVVVGDCAGTPFGADAFAGQAQTEVLDGAGAGAVVFAAPKRIAGDDLADGDDFGGIAEFGADPLLFVFGQGFAVAFDDDGQFGDGLASFGAHEIEAPGIGEFVVRGADGGFERAGDGAFGKRRGEVIVDGAAVDDGFVTGHGSTHKIEIKGRVIIIAWRWMRLYILAFRKFMFPELRMLKRCIL